MSDDPAPFAPTSQPTDLRPWPEVFLSRLAESGNVSAAAVAADRSRRACYDLRKADPAFAAAWDDALESATDALELEARRRALEGCREPVYYQGEEVGTIRRYSDQLMVFLLKAHRPGKYREQTLAEHTGEVVVRVVYDDEPDPAGLDRDPPPPAPPGPGPLPLEG